MGACLAVWCAAVYACRRCAAVNIQVLHACVQKGMAAMLAQRVSLHVTFSHVCLSAASAEDSNEEELDGSDEDSEDDDDGYDSDDSEQEKKRAGKGKAAGAKRSAAAAGIGSQEPGSEVSRCGYSGMAAGAAACAHVGACKDVHTMFDQLARPGMYIMRRLDAPCVAG